METVSGTRSAALVAIGLGFLALLETLALGPLRDASWSLAASILLSYTAVFLLVMAVALGLAAARAVVARFAGRPAGAALEAPLFLALTLVAGFGHGWPLAKGVLAPAVGRPLALLLFAAGLGGALYLLRRSMTSAPELVLVLVGIFLGALGFDRMRAEPLGVPAPPAPLALSVVLALAVGLVLVFCMRRFRRVAIVTTLALFALVVRFVATDPHAPIDRASRSNGAASSELAEGPPVFFLVVDTLRGDALELAGEPGETGTPRIAELARTSDRFENVVANGSWTIPGHASLLTGMRVSEHRVDMTSVDGFGSRLAPSVPTLHQRFARAGYRTTCISANGIVGPSTGLVEGCGRYVHPGRAWILQSLPLRLAYAISPSARPSLEEQLLTELTGVRRHATAREVVDLALHELDRGTSDGDRAAPYQFLNFMDVHRAYPVRGAEGFEGDRWTRFLFDLLRTLVGLESPESFDRRHATTMRRAYDRQVSGLDAELGRFFDELRERGLWDDSLVVVTSDHGEAFYDNPETPLYYDHHGAYEAAVRIPLLVKRPRARSGATFVHLVEQADVAPAVAEMAGLESESERVSGVERLYGRTPGGGESGAALTEWNPHPVPGSMSTLADRRVALYRGGFKFVLEISEEGDWSEARPSLFDLTNDPFEAESLHPHPRSNELMEELLGHLAEAWRRGDGLAVEERAADELLERLRALGYID